MIWLWLIPALIFAIFVYAFCYAAADPYDHEKSDLDREVMMALALQGQRGTPEGEKAWKTFRDAQLKRRGYEN